MITLLMILGAMAIGLGVGLMSPKSERPKKPKKKRFPDPPGWGTPHGF